MSVNLSSVAAEQFDSEVKHAYQGAMTLRECIRLRTGVNGDKYDFRLMGKGTATQRTGPSALLKSFLMRYTGAKGWKEIEY